LAARVVGLDHRAGATGPLEVIADIVGGHAAHHGFDRGAVPASEQAPSYTKLCLLRHLRSSKQFFEAIQDH
jgi:hypothetical protein